ncbi:MAG: hypothetical protein H0U24_00950 [Thermoleophilaceae bacterium]|nr:hypothetical protein [Thermoleophilaceae bacterium]
MSLFCRHNRFSADCPICSKGTVLEGARSPARRRASGATRRPKAQEAASRSFSGRYVSAGPYDDGERSYEVRLERVPGGIRLAEWDGSGLRRRAPVLAAADVSQLVEGAADVLDAPDAVRLVGALETGAGEVAEGGGPGPAPGVSPGSSGDFKEELRVEPVGEGLVRIARWVLRPGSGWNLQEAPPMLPAARYAEALADATRTGALTAASDAGDAARL